MDNKVPYNFIADKLQIKREIYNPNPRQRTTSGNDRIDCVVRTLCKMTGKSWKQVFDALCKISMDICRMPDSKYVTDIFLINHGWIIFNEYKKYQNIAMFMNDMRFAEMDFIIMSSYHLCFYSHGIWYDNKACLAAANEFLICEKFIIYVRNSDIDKLIEYNKNKLDINKVEKTNDEKLEIAVNTLKAISEKLSSNNDYKNSSILDDCIKAADNALKIIEDD